MSVSSQRLLPGALGTSVVVSLLSSLLFLGGCGPQPTYQVVESPPPARVGTVESVREVVEQKHPSGAGLIAAPTGLRVGDRVRVTDRGLEMLR